MNEQSLDDQQDTINNCSVPIQVVALKTSWERWMIETGGERGSGRSVHAAWHGDFKSCFKVAEYTLRIWELKGSGTIFECKWCSSKCTGKSNLVDVYTWFIFLFQLLARASTNTVDMDNITAQQFLLYYWLIRWHKRLSVDPAFKPTVLLTVCLNCGMRLGAIFAGIKKGSRLFMHKLVVYNTILNLNPRKVYYPRSSESFQVFLTGFSTALWI